MKTQQIDGITIQIEVDEYGFVWKKCTLADWLHENGYTFTSEGEFIALMTAKKVDFAEIYDMWDEIYAKYCDFCFKHDVLSDITWRDLIN